MKLKVGDLVRWDSVQNDHQEEFDVDYGIVIATTGSDKAPPLNIPITTVQVLWPDESVSWMNPRLLKIVNPK